MSIIVWTMCQIRRNVWIRGDFDQSKIEWSLKGQQQKRFVFCPIESLAPPNTHPFPKQNSLSHWKQIPLLYSKFVTWWKPFPLVFWLVVQPNDLVCWLGIPRPGMAFVPVQLAGFELAWTELGHSPPLFVSCFCWPSKFLIRSATLPDDCEVTVLLLRLHPGKPIITSS